MTLLRTLIVGLLYPFDPETRRNTAMNASALRPSTYVRRRQSKDPVWNPALEDSCANLELLRHQNMRRSGAIEIVVVKAKPQFDPADVSDTTTADGTEGENEDEEDSGITNSTGKTDGRSTKCLMQSEDRADAAPLILSRPRVTFHPAAELIGEKGLTVAVRFSAAKTPRRSNTPLNAYDPHVHYRIFAH